jgi:hypothetical protein
MFWTLSKVHRCTGRELRKNSTIRRNRGASGEGGVIPWRAIHPRTAFRSPTALPA